jgi:DNA-binding IclR family transcriptional regulator
MRPKRTAEQSPVAGATYLRRVVSLLEALAHSPDPVTLWQLAEATSLTRPTAYRILTTLQSAGLVSRCDPPSYQVGPALIELSAATLSELNIRHVAMPEMRDLHDALKETVTLTLRESDDYVYLETIESSLEIRLSVRLGLRTPLVRGASGKAILAALPPAESDQIMRRAPLEWPVAGTPLLTLDRLRVQVAEARNQGFAWTDGERIPHAFAVAAAIRGEDGRPLGTITISGPDSRFNTARLEEAAPPLIRAVERVSLLSGRRSANGVRHKVI